MDEERTPNPEHTAILDEGQRSRGRLINSFAQIEYLLGDIPVRAWALPEFAFLKEKQMPMDVDNRMKSIRRLLGCRGHMAEFSERLEPLLIRFGRIESLRHFLIHGFCSFRYTPSGHAYIRFLRYASPGKKEVSELLELYLRPEGLVEAQAEWLDLTEQFVDVCRDLYRQLDLKKVGPSPTRVHYRSRLLPGSYSR